MHYFSYKNGPLLFIRFSNKRLWKTNKGFQTQRPIQRTIWKRSRWRNHLWRIIFISRLKIKKRKKKIFKKLIVYWFSISRHIRKIMLFLLDPRSLILFLRSWMYYFCLVVLLFLKKWIKSAIMRHSPFCKQIKIKWPIISTYPSVPWN